MIKLHIELHYTILCKLLHEQLVTQAPYYQSKVQEAIAFLFFNTAETESFHILDLTCTDLDGAPTPVTWEGSRSE